MGELGGIGRNPGSICIEKTEALGKSFDYPSGHASLGWTAGLVMAQLAPDRASEVLARGQAYGESRLVCGVHNLSAVEAGRTNAAGVCAALQSSSEFQAMMTKARVEVDAARRSGAKPEATWCAKEAELVKPLQVHWRDRGRMALCASGPAIPGKFVPLGTENSCFIARIDLGGRAA